MENTCDDQAPPPCDCLNAPAEAIVTIGPVTSTDDAGTLYVVGREGKWWLELPCGHVVRELREQEVVAMRFNFYN